MKRPQTKSGFTLVELLVAAAITALLAAFVFAITSGLLSSWNRSRDVMASSNQATIALDQLVQDLEALVLRADGNTWLAVTVTGEQTGQGDAGIPSASYPAGGSKPPPGDYATGILPPSRSIEDCRFGHMGVWLRFFTMEADKNDSAETLSTVRAVSYQIARVPVDGTVGGPEVRYFLHRSSVRGGPVLADGSRLDESSYRRSTFTTGYDIVGNNEYNNPAGQVDNDPLEPGRTRRPIVSQVIASDVVDFGIRVYCEEPGRRAVERFPADRRLETGPTPLAPTPVWAFLATSSTTATPVNPAIGPAGLAATPQRGFPVAIEVMLRVLTDEGAKKIRALESGNVSTSDFDGDWWRIVEANSEVFTRRIEIRSRPL